MRETTAYPRMANANSMKYIAIVVLGMLVVFLFFLEPSNPSNMGDIRTADTSNAEGTWTDDKSALAAINKRKSAKLSELLIVGMQLTDKAAEVITEVKSNREENTKVKGYTAEGVMEPVTVADNLSNKVFVNGFRNHFGPDIPILSEETEPEKDSIMVDDPDFPADFQANLVAQGQDPTLDLSKVLIIIDPLDATKEFSENLLNYVTTMVCVVYEGKPIAGIVNEVFRAEEQAIVGVMAGGEGASGILLNRKKQGPVDEEAAHTVTISRSHTGEGGNVVEKYLEDHKVLLAGGAGYKALLVLDGKAEAYVHVTAIKSWDVCAAEVVTKAAGGEFTDITGEPLIYTSDHSEAMFTNGIIATGSKKDHDWFLQSLDGRLS